MKNQNFSEAVASHADFLFSNMTPQEVEDVLFETFQRAELYSDGDFQNDREARALVHGELRSLLRVFAAKPKKFRKLLQKTKQWQLQNITETN